MSGTTPLTITVRPELTRTLAKLTAMRPHERAVAAGRIREELQAARVACTMVRREAVWDLRDEGCTWQQIADLLGMSKQKAHFLGMRDLTPAERAAASED